MDSGAHSLTMVSFTLDLPSLGRADKFRMIHSRQCYWGTVANRDNLRLSPNNLTAYAAGKRILNPYHTRWCNSPQMNAVISGLHAKVWGPFAMARSRALCVQVGPMCDGIPFSTYSWSRGASGCKTASVSSPRVLLCLEEMKAFSEGSCLSTSKIARSLAARSSALEPTGGR